MLTEQQQTKIDQEAKAEAKKLTARVPIFRHGYEAGWYDAGEKYATLYETALARAERAEKFIQDIADADCDYENINFKQKHNPECRSCKARVFLTPKQGSDENS